MAQIDGVNEAKSTQYEISYALDDWSFAAAHNNIGNVNTFVITYGLGQGTNLAAEYKTKDRTDNTGDVKVVSVQLAHEILKIDNANDNRYYSHFNKPLIRKIT